EIRDRVVERGIGGYDCWSSTSGTAGSVGNLDSRTESERSSRGRPWGIAPRWIAFHSGSWFAGVPSAVVEVPAPRRVDDLSSGTCPTDMMEFMTMGYLLLTGATGLLGRYLMRDLLSAGVPLAVLVRRSRRKTPGARVEAAIRSWEELEGRTFERP